MQFVSYLGHKEGNSGGSGGQGGGDDNWKKLWDQVMSKVQGNMGAMLAVGLTGAFLFATSYNPSKEINWQDFRTGYLERGEVDRIVITNKSTANIYLKVDPAVVSVSVIVCDLSSIEYDFALSAKLLPYGA